MLLVVTVDRIIALGGPKRVGRRPARLPISYVAIGSEDVPIVGLGWGECSAGLVPAGVGVGRRRIRRANSLYQATTPAFHTLVCRRQPA